jgi:EmrB/QacA subfamily drug resistance transporter
MPTDKHYKWLVLAIIALGFFMSTATASSINIANPVLVQVFGIGMEQVQWVTTLFLLVVTSLMLLLGRIGDRIGGQKVYIAGLLIFCLGSLWCGLSSSFPSLLSGRALQALGSAMLMATGMGIVTNTFPLEQRGMAMGFGMLMVSLGNMCGPGLGALILEHYSWSYIFFVNLPFGVLSLILALRFLRAPRTLTRAQGALDIRGALLLATVVSSLILGLSGGFPGSRLFFLLFAAALPVFIWAEKKHAAPLWDFALIRNHRFAIGNLVAFLSYFANMCVAFLLPFFLQQVWNLPVSSIGFFMMLSPLCIAVAGPLAGFLSDRIGALLLMPLALFVSIGALLTLFFLPATPFLPQLAAGLLLVGLGMGMLNTPNNSEIMTAAGPEYAGYAGSFVATNRNLAFCLGTAAAAGVFPLLLTHFQNGAAYTTAYLLSLRCLIGVSLLATLVSLIICLWLKKSLARG